MKNLNFWLIGIAALVIGLLIGMLAFPVTNEVTKIEKCQPAAVCETKICDAPVKCEVCKVCSTTYEGKYDSKKEAEKALNTTLYKLKSSRTCQDFLDSFESRTKIIEDFRDVEDGCEILYSFK